MGKTENADSEGVPSPAGSPQVAIIMGSRSDWPTLRHAAVVLAELNIAFDTKVVSAHRTPDRLVSFAKGARQAGYKVIIAGAGGAAHLPGMVAAMTSLPVLGVPVVSHTLNGLDSLLSIVQMPAGVPVATLAIGKPGSINAGLLAASILATNQDVVQKALDGYRQRQTAAVSETVTEI